ncbi:MAG TPA: Fic/DOC family protein [Flavobacteriia bacterium]|nr:Fic/DOC family protein [Flavobacteriia bacterium]
MNKSEIILYELGESQPKIKVLVENETVWLSQNQMVELFQKTKQNISLHINNCFREKELNKNSVVKEYLTTASDGKKYKTKYYNLDVIISVGYRVKSQRGTEFRIWATQVLRNYILQGYSVNIKRLKELKQSIQLIQNTVGSDSLEKEQTKAIVEVLSEFALGLDLLDGYDHQNIEIKETTPTTKYVINYDEAIEAIEGLRLKFGGSNLFGKEKDESFKSSIGTINQTFGGRELYPSIEEKAANLLYFVVKNHSFTDGNKRIAAWLFVWYLNKNRYLYSRTGQPKIANNALAALTLMVALSKPEEKELIIKIIINSINKDNEVI